jgi:uroporphyrinogen decarboxylase-like protein
MSGVRNKKTRSRQNLWRPARVGRIIPAIFSPHEESTMLDRCLDDLEARIDEDVEQQLYDEWLNFTNGTFDGDIFCPKRSKKSPPAIEWPKALVNETLDDFDKMALQQFGGCSNVLAEGSGQLMCVRSNYGTSIIPSMFGVELFMMDAEQDTLPTSWPLSPEKIEAAIEACVPDIAEAEGSDSLAGKTLQMAKRFAEIKAAYPKIGKYVHCYHPDLQGPMDVCEVLWGSGLFVDLVDKPDRAKAFLDILTDTYTRFLKRWAEILPFSEGCNVHWCLLHEGSIMLRDDSAMNVSPAMFDEFIKPCDQRLLDEFGGGGLHFCGRGDHYIESMCEMRGANAIAMSQPEYNDMEVIYKSTVDRGVKLLGFPRDAADAALAAGRDLHSNVHCWS